MKGLVRRIRVTEGESAARSSLTDGSSYAGGNLKRDRLQRRESFRFSAKFRSLGDGMTKLKKHVRTTPMVVLCLLILGGAAAFAQKKFMMIRAGRPEVKVQLSAVVERDNGKIPVEKAAGIKSGEILDWTITSANEGDASASEYKAVGKIPLGTQFVAGSATADGSAAVTYSIDNGKSFFAQPLIEEKQPDGSTKKVPAPASMYTQLRYEWADPLVQGAKLSASYKVRLK
jgi:uncharacterized repeat protein (TIGR01451 family)